MKITSIAIVLVALLSILALWDRAFAGGPVLITGTVTATNTTTPPEILVVKTVIAKGKDLIVGCRLDEKTVIKVGHRPAKLDDLQVGDRVNLTYSRVEDGLVCHTIVKRAKMEKKSG